MSWLTEVRAATRGLGVDTVEMSDAVLVIFDASILWLFSNRSTQVVGRNLGAKPLSSPNDQSIVDTIWSRLDRRIWRAE